MMMERGRHREGDIERQRQRQIIRDRERVRERRKERRERVREALVCLSEVTGRTLLDTFRGADT